MKDYSLDTEVRKMLENFYTMSGIRVGLHSLNNEIIGEYRHIAPDRRDYTFCEMIRYDHPADFSMKCFDCDINAIERVRKTKKTLIYRCHVGFMEALVPITAHGEVFCVLFIGQIIDENDSAMTKARVRDMFDIMKCSDEVKAEYTAAYEKMPVLSAEKLRAYVYFLEISAQSIYDNSHISRLDVSKTEQFRYYISRNLCSHITISDAAKNLGLSTSHLSKIISRDMGTTFTQYLTQCRMEEAKRMLRTSSQSVISISLMLKFNEPTYFMRQFKKYTGMSCTEYRRTVGEAKGGGS